MTALTWVVAEGVTLKKPARRSLRPMLRRLGVPNQAVIRRSDFSEYDWAKEGLLCWPAPDGSRTARPSRRLLDRFAGLADANAEAFKDFASSYGPLYLCRHGRPLGHRVQMSVRDLEPDWLDDRVDDPDERSLDAPARKPGPGRTEEEADDRERYYLREQWSRTVLSLPCSQVDRPAGTPVVEGIADWRRLARQASGTRRILRLLNGGEPAPADLWREYEAVVLEPVEAWLPTGDDQQDGSSREEWAGQAPRVRTRLAVNEQRAWIGFFLDEWLRQSLLRPQFRWHQVRAALDPMGPGSLFAAIALQLVEEAKDGQEVVCHNCRRNFRATRRPAVGRNVYCDRVGCKEARKATYERPARTVPR